MNIIISEFDSKKKKLRNSTQSQLLKFKVIMCNKVKFRASLITVLIRLANPYKSVEKLENAINFENRA